jgi:hypothetical protein
MRAAHSAHPHMTTFLILPLLCTTLPQAAASQASANLAGPAGVWQPLNGVEAIINEEIITRSGLIQRLQWQISQGAVTTEAEYTRALLKGRDDEIIARLKVQAGQDMGLAPEEVERLVDARRERLKEGLGGALKMREWLRSEGLDSSRLNETISTALIGGVWEDAITGKGGGLRGRPQADRFIRPGQLHASYLECLADENLWHLVGGQPAQYVLQTLDLPLDEADGLAATMDMANSLRERAQAGGDFAALVDSYGRASAPGGYQRAHTAQDLKELLGEAAQKLIADGTIGGLSEVLPVLRADQVAGVRILRLARILPSEQPKGFLEPGVQRDLERLIQDGMDQSRVLEELRDLDRAAYVWPATQVPEQAATGLAP